MTQQDLQRIMPHCPTKKIEANYPSIEQTLSQFLINTPLRQAHFLAQLAHESVELQYPNEIASGAQYEGRTDLGNTQKGDGVRFKGRGFIQITGRHNYGLCGLAFGLDLIAHPELLEVAPMAALSAGWFWQTKDLNRLADADNLDGITRRINGGLTGIDSRRAYLLKAKAVLIPDEPLPAVSTPS